MTITIEEYLRKKRKEREKIFFSSWPTFLKNKEEGRNFYITLATISSGIGAFSFLLPETSFIKNNNFLRAGDITLLALISASLFSYIIALKKDFHSFHDEYYSVFEEINEEIAQAQKYFNKEIGPKDYETFIKNKIDSISSYERPAKEPFDFKIFLVSYLLLALLLIALSMF